MSKRRTRLQKATSLAKRALIEPESKSGVDALGRSYLRSDLTRAAIVTILALILEIMAKLYLERG